MQTVLMNSLHFLHDYLAGWRGQSSNFLVKDLLIINEFIRSS
jgi:hypothetical protein